MMRLYTPAEICRIFDHVDRLQIADLIKQGIVTPTQEAAGRGSANLYDERRVLHIGLAIALRDILNRRFTRRTLEKVEEKLKLADMGNIPKWDVMVIHYSFHKKDEKGRSGKAEFLTYSFRHMNWASFRFGYAGKKAEMPDPRQYRTIVLNVSDLQAHIKSRG